MLLIDVKFCSVSAYLPLDMRLYTALFLCISVLSSNAQNNSKWSLQKCIDYALEHNISIKQNQLQTSILENNLVQSKWNRAPGVNASGSHNYNIGRNIDPFTNSFKNQNIQSNAFSVSAGLTLFAGNSISNTIKKNGLDLAAGQEGLEVIENQIKLQVASAYLLIVQSEETLKSSELSVKSTENQLDRAKKLVESGAQNQGTTLNLEAQLANDKMQVINAQNQIQLAYNNMLNLLQIPQDSVFEVELISVNNIPPMPNESIAEIYTMAASQLPELKQAELQVQSSVLSQKIAAAGRYPTLSAFGNVNTVYSESGLRIINLGFETKPIGYVQGSQDLVLTQEPVIEYEINPFGQQLQDNFGQSVGLSLSIPVFNNLRNTTNYENAKLNSQIAELNKDQTVNQLRSDITTAYTNLKAAKSSFEASLSNEKAQALSYDFNLKRFEAGMLNATDLINSKNQYAQAQNQLINAKYEYLFRLMIIEFYKGNDIKLSND